MADARVCPLQRIDCGDLDAFDEFKKSDGTAANLKHLAAKALETTCESCSNPIDLRNHVATSC